MHRMTENLQMRRMYFVARALQQTSRSLQGALPLVSPSVICLQISRPSPRTDEERNAVYDTIYVAYTYS